MAKKDYTKYVKTPIESKEVAVEEVAVEEVVVEEVVVEETEPTVYGKVVNCTKLNVRVAPNANADVVCVIDASANLVINEDESINGYWKVCTETGAEGFCMGQYIKILP